MAILELRGLKVLPPPDLDDGESLWIGPGAAQPRQCGGAGSGVLAGATDGGGRLLCRWSLALRGRFRTVSAGKHKTTIKPSGVDRTLNKIKSCDPNLVFSQQTCDHSRTLLLIS